MEPAKSMEVFLLSFKALWVEQSLKDQGKKGHDPGHNQKYNNRFFFLSYQHNLYFTLLLSFLLIFPSMPFHPSLCSPSTSSPTEVNRQWATSKGRFALDIPFGERENNYSYSSGLGTHEKRMLPKNRKERKQGQNKKGE